MGEPIVLEDLNDYQMPKLIRITERDKKYSESEVCKGSIGFWSDFKEMRLMNIFLCLFTTITTLTSLNG